MKYKLLTLGCKVNQFETQALETMLKRRGYTEAGEGEQAGLVVVNTCAVTAESGRKSRQAVRRLKSENPGALVAVCGCFSQLSPEDTAALGADIVHGSGEKARLAEDIEKALNQREAIAFTDDPFLRKTMEELPTGAVDGRTRAMLKIQDGCTNFCSYCIIPYTRGRVRSLPSARCAAQAEELSRRGFKELVVTGIEIASFGRDLNPKETLAEAIEAIAGSCGEMRIRLGSLEPTVVTADFAKRLRATGKACDHFHLSLQSGSDSVLKRMNRKYDTARFMEAVNALRENFPGCGLTADLIVGFPGETEKEHRETLAFLRKVGFSSMHIFPYSIRPGTKAAEMEGQLSHAEKAVRAAEAQKVAAELEKNYLSSCLGRTFSVLFETEENGMSMGHAANYVQVCANGRQLRGLVKSVEITGILDKMLGGIIV